MSVTIVLILISVFAAVPSIPKAYAINSMKSRGTSNNEIAVLFNNVERALRDSNEELFRKCWHEKPYWLDFGGDGFPGARIFKEMRSQRAELLYKGKPIQKGYYFGPSEPLEPAIAWHSDNAIIVSSFFKFMASHEEQKFLSLMLGEPEPQAGQLSNQLSEIYISIVRADVGWQLVGLGKNYKQLERLMMRYLEVSSRSKPLK
jgi:hypothetical protein